MNVIQTKIQCQVASNKIIISQIRPKAKYFVVDVDVGQTDLHKYTNTDN